MSSSSDSTSSPPGQRSAEVPHRLKYDDFASFMWAFLMLLFPPMWVDRHRSLHKRFWAWRYIYLSFFLVSAIFFLTKLRAGEYIWAALFPFAHLLAPLSAGGLVVGYSIPGLSLPIVTYQTTVILYCGAIGLTAVGDVLRRTSPAMFARNQWEHDEGVSVVPLDEVSTKAQDAETPATLDQDVSTAVIGETGSGKTSMMSLLAYQFPYDRNTAVIAHDTGGEYHQFYKDLGFEVRRVSATDGDIVWNLFADADSEAEFREVAGAIFGEPDGHDPFHRPAKQTFQDMLLYLHLEAKRNSRRHALCNADIVSLLDQGHIALKEALDEYDRLDSGHIDPDKGKGAKNVYQTLRENVRPVFVDDFANYGEFSLKEYIENPDGRVLIIDSEPTRMETLGPMYQLLLDWSIRYAMNAPNPTAHILDEIDALPPLTQVTNLTARGRKNKARALIGVQTIGQLEDTYSTISGIMGNCPQGVYFGPGDSESTEFILDELGEHRQMDRQQMVAMSHQGHGDSPRSQSRDTYKEKDKTPITSGLLRDFEPGECIVVSRTAWWHGHSYEPHEIRESLPEQGAESPTTPRTVDSEDADLEDHDSWLSLARSKLTGSESADEEGDDDENGDTELTDDNAGEAADETEQDTEVWTVETDAQPELSFLDSKWKRTLTRLDVQEPPITEKDNVDAINDLATMLDDQIRMVPETMQEKEVSVLLTDIVDHTGLSKAQTTDVVTDRTELLRVNDAFKESFTDGEATGPTDPFAEETYETIDTTTTSTSTTQSADNESEAEAAETESDSTPYDDPNPKTDSQGEDDQYSLDGLEDALPDDSKPTDSTDTSPVSEDNIQSDTAETDPPTHESVDSEEENSEAGQFDPEDYW